MGGDFEGMIGAEKKTEKSGIGGLLQPASATQPKSGLPVVGELSQAIRFHQNPTGSEIHFHVDDEKLKVALPVAEWWSAWEQVKNMRLDQYRYVDHKNGTMLELTSGLDGAGKFEILPKVSRIANGVGAIYERLEDFTCNVQKKKK